MQWILQDFEDMRALAPALDRLGLRYSWHRVVPFVGALEPDPDIADPAAVVLFGSYALWRYAERHDLSPGVFRIRPFVREAAWADRLLNGPGARFVTVEDVPAQVDEDETAWFVRPVSDNKELSGTVMTGADLVARARKVVALDPADIPNGALRHDTELMLAVPARILREWRVWIVADEVVTYSLYREGARVIYRPEIDDDALAFARMLISENPRYAPAYVMDLCRTADGLRLLETNCINAAGFYAADLPRLAAAVDAVEVP